MSFIKKDVNFTLLLIIIVLAVALTSIGLYYTENYQSLSTKYTQQLDTLKKVTEDLLQHKSLLNQTSQDLQIRSQDENELNKRYNELRDAKEKLDKDFADKSAQLETAKADILTKANQLSIQQNQLNDKQSQIDVLNANNARLQSKVSKLENELKTYTNP
jgi:chromosome segregation ATPase